jgi:gliding motility-associated-like protein
MSEKDIFKDVFSDKLANHESAVNPQLWTSISSKVAASSITTSAVGGSVLTKFIIGGFIAAASVVGFVYLSPTNPKEVGQRGKKEIKATPIKEQVTSKSQTTEKEEIIIVNRSEPTLLECKILSSPFLEEVSDLNVAPNDLTEEKIIKDKSPVLSSIVEENKKVLVESKSPEQLIQKVSQSELIVKEDVAPEFFIEALPNVFSPNNDGVNDEFNIKSAGLKDYSLVILNDKNQIVFKSDDSNFSWNGLGVNGELVEEGNYLYYLTAFNSAGKMISKSSYLKVMR